MAAIATTDACDAYSELLASGDLRPLQPIFQIYGRARAFAGPIVTVKAVDDNYEVIQQLASRGNGRVLVIDGSGGMRTALMGSLLAGLAQKNGGSGVVVNGYIRDVDEINGVNIGVRALGSYPVKPSKKGGGEKHVPVYIGGTWIGDGEWLYADSDGILVSKTELSVSVVVNHAILFNNVNVLSDLRLP
ncbi:putative 4-hydroxy-4-methyl-2-oxoglutarate aldolase 3 [Aristolochia californica]|uniref:putative 4-hydroxy-4-methyl-2-oxoglutarate aldolase 3 n=1 Tax=Aristolochia californica TaxID=171875 RepID=UPI0035D8D8BE